MENLMQKRPSPSMAVAMVALFVALTGTSIGADGGKTRLPANSVGAKQLKPGAVTTPDIAPGAVTTPVLANNAVRPQKINPGAVKPSALAPEAVGPAALAPNSVTSSAIGPRAVTELKLQTGAVTSSVLANDAVTTPKLANDSISKSKLKEQVVGPAQLEPAAVTAPKIGPQAVTSTALAPQAVTPTAIAPQAVTPTAIAPEAVTSSAIAGSSVGTTQMSSTIPAASAFKDTNTTWNNNAYTVLGFPSESFDTANLHGAANYRMKAPVAGVYSATVVATWKNDGCGGTRSLEFNGRRADDSTPFLPSPYISSTVPANGSSTTTQSLSGMVQLAAGESLEIWGGAGGMGCGTTETLGSPAASFTMTWIAPGS